MGKYTLKLPNNYELKISSDLEGSIRSFVAKVEIVSKIEGEVSVTIEGYFLFCLWILFDGFFKLKETGLCCREYN